MKAAISVHSFGSVLIYPWGYKVTRMTLDNVKSLMKRITSRTPCFPCYFVNLEWECQLTGYISQEKQHERRVPLASLANEISQAILSRTGERYEPGTAREVFGLWGLAGGATDDWYITQVARSTFLRRESAISKLGFKTFFVATGPPIQLHI